MRKTPAEYQREYRERKKAVQKAAPDLAGKFVKRPLSDTRPSNGDFTYDFVEYFVPVGFEFPDGFFDECAIYDVDALVGEEISMSGRPLLERMEALAGICLDAATELYRTINEFKLEEIDARISEVQQADLSSPAAKARALQDIVALQTIRAQLDGKTFRRAFSEISVKGSTSN